jgi:hypothetical protein
MQVKTKEWSDIYKMKKIKPKPIIADRLIGYDVYCKGVKIFFEANEFIGEDNVIASLNLSKQFPYSIIPHYIRREENGSRY